MDYEKMYKEAVGKIQELLEEKKKKEMTNCLFEGELNEIFSELRESEDERIRNAIIIALSLNEAKGYLRSWGISYDDAKIWLEKQGEQKLTLPKWKYKKDHTPLLRDSLILNKYGCVAKSPSGAIVSDVWVIDYGELAKLPKEEIEKQGEQRPIDKVEPKFKVGDVVRSSNGASLLIVGITDYCYNCVICATNDEYSFGFDIQDEFEFIEDKKEWSEEDKIHLDAAIHLARNTGHIETANWLKFRKDRYTWKPSEEDLSAILVARNNVNSINADILRKLYNELKRL